MIELIIFHLHILAALYVFTKNWQKLSVKDGLLAVAIVAIAFVTGWSIASSIGSLIYPNSWHTKYFTEDTFALLCLTLFESLFFYCFFIKEGGKINKN